MQEIYDLITRALKYRLTDLTADRVAQTFATWELIPLLRGVEVMGVALRKQQELHIIIDPQYQNSICFFKWSVKIVAETIAKYGYAETKVATDHLVGHRLAGLLGFDKVASDETATYYRKGKI